MPLDATVAITASLFAFMKETTFSGRDCLFIFSYCEYIKNQL
jgi:hypothetical protein